MKFNIGDKVVLLNHQQGNVYDVTYITRHGDYVIEHEAWGASIYSGNHIELYKPPTFSYFHLAHGLHNWYVESDWNVFSCVIKSADLPNITAIVPVELVKHYLGDKYVRR